MKLFNIIVVFALAIAGCTEDSSVDEIGQSGHLNSTGRSSKVVYYCSGGKSKSYHTVRDCRGLRRCSGEIKEISISEVGTIGREDPCNFCAD